MHEELPDRITGQGMAVLYTSDPIVRGRRRLMEEVGSRLGRLPMRLILVPLFRVNYPKTPDMQEHYDHLGLSGYDDCILTIQRANRYEAKRRPWDWLHYQRTCFDSWLVWRRRAKRR